MSAIVNFLMKVKDTVLVRFWKLLTKFPRLDEFYRKCDAWFDRKSRKDDAWSTIPHPVWMELHFFLFTVGVDHW